ncbi:MAG: hypothetical protein E5W09_26230 [Mesorhizobium sp.]|nr:MAG: hypothetical protein E5W09_26230 [Mesorhizobium sp.]
MDFAVHGVAAFFARLDQAIFEFGRHVEIVPQALCLRGVFVLLRRHAQFMEESQLARNGAKISEKCASFSPLSTGYRYIMKYSVNQTPRVAPLAKWHTEKPKTVLTERQEIVPVRVRYFGLGGGFDPVWAARKGEARRGNGEIAGRDVASIEGGCNQQAHLYGNALNCRGHERDTRRRVERRNRS